MKSVYKYSLLKNVVLLAMAVVAVDVLRSAIDAHAQESTLAPPSAQDKAAVWNSPAMLRSRAWLADYCKSSDAITEAEAAGHLAALESMTPEQMKIFAMRHEAAEKDHPAAKVHQTHQQALHNAAQAAAAQKWWYENVHKAETARALAGDAQTAQSLSDLSVEESAAANQEQGQLNAEQAAARANQEAKLDELNTPYSNWGYGNIGVGYPGYGGIHYHFHTYPGP